MRRPTGRAARSEASRNHSTVWRGRAIAGVAIGSRPLFDEYERKLREVGTRLDPHLRNEDIPLLRRQMEAVCVIAAPPFADSAVPSLTADPKDDPILYTALVAGADLLISSDKHLVPDKKEEFWEHEAGTVLALTFETLLADRLSGVDWDGIDGSWLTLADDQSH